MLNALPVFLRDLIGYLIETALRPALRIILENDIRPAVGLIVKDAIRALVEGLTTVFVGFLAGLGTVIIETMKWGGDWIAYAIVKVLNKLPGVDIDYAEPKPLGERLRQGLKEAFLGSQELGRMLAKTPISPQRGLEGLLGGGAAAVAAVKQQGFVKGVPMTAKTAPEVLGRTFSGAELKKLKSEHDRTLNFKFIVDGREHRPGEPERRRNDDGHILADLAILRSFVYPRLADLLDILGAAFGSESNRWLQLWFNQPPTAILVLGSTSVEGFVTELKITETLFNADLDPLRAEVEVTMIEKIDSLSFIIDSVKRLGRTFYHTAYEDIGDVII